MMMLRRALPALLPAILAAQAPDADQTFAQRLRAEAPATEQLLAAYRAMDARSKAESLLPAQVPAWDESNPQGQLASFQAYRDYIYAYFLAARATDAAGDWEKALDYYQKTRDLSQANADKAGKHFPAIVDYYKDMGEKSRKTLVENADYIQSLRAKANPDPGDLQQLDLVKKEEENAAKALKNAQLFEGYLETARKEAAYYTKFAEQEDAQIKALDKALEEYAYKNDKAKFVEGTLAAKGYLEAQYPDKAARVRFLYRLHQMAPGSRKAVQEIESQTGVLLPMPPEEKAAPKKRKH